MKVADLPQKVLDDLCQESLWRLDIDPGFESKHEFWMDWSHFLKKSEAEGAENLAEFIRVEGYDLLLPVPRSHHRAIHPIRVMPSRDGQCVTIFLQDSFHEEWFKKPTDARYGFVGIADRYRKFGADFYLASYYHFSFLIGEDYEKAREALSRRLAERDNPSGI